ncbi:uncharacterized protein ACIBXB_022071 [Morphnus guianensis]
MGTTPPCQGGAAGGGAGAASPRVAEAGPVGPKGAAERRPGCGGPEGEGDRGPSNGPAGPGESPEEGGGAWGGAGRVCVGGTGQCRVGADGGGCLEPEQPGGGSAGQLPALRGKSCLGVAACRAAVSPIPPPCFQRAESWRWQRCVFSSVWGWNGFASRYPYLLVSAQPARKDQAAARFAPAGWDGEEKREEKARGSRRGQGGIAHQLWSQAKTRLNLGNPPQVDLICYKSNPNRKMRSKTKPQTPVPHPSLPLSFPG